MRGTASRLIWETRCQVSRLASESGEGPPYFHQIDKDAEVSNSHVPIEKLLFMNLGTAKHRPLSHSPVLLVPSPAQLVIIPSEDMAASVLIRVTHTVTTSEHLTENQ